MTEHFLHPWDNVTTLHAVGAVAIVVLGLAVLMLPRRLVVVPILVMACFVAPAQRIVLLGLDFNLLRIMVLFGWTRLIVRGELTALRLRPLDVVVAGWALCGSLAYVLLHGSMNAVINRSGFMFDVLGMYFLFRGIIRSWSDVATVARSAALVSVPVAIFFLIEKYSGHNLFAVFGGVPEHTLIRQGRLRCQGAFAHPILAGSFWAALLPIVAALWRRGTADRITALVGMVAAVIIVLASSSSTPLMAVAAGALAMALFPLRHWMKSVRWTALGMVIAAQVLMTRPVWHLLARIDLAGGSTGWYRYLLIDRFVRHFDQWVLLGTPSTEHWWRWGMGDVTNQYVLEGVNGGLATLVLFLATIAVAFAGVGAAVRRIERRGHPVQRRRAETAGASGVRTGRRRRRVVRRAHPDLVMAWAVGTSLFVHSAVFVAVSYFGQMTMLWYLALAIAGSIAPPLVRARRRHTAAAARRHERRKLRIA